MYAYVTDDVINRTGGLPPSARRLDTGDWVLGLDNAPEDVRRECGWFEVVDTPRPPDTDTTTHDQTVELVKGLPTVVWVERQVDPPDIDPTHSVDDPLTAEVAGLRAVVEAVLADPEIAKVADIAAIRTAAEGSKDDDALVLAVAKVLGADPAEVRKKRDADPQWFADVVAKYGLDQTKSDEVGAVKG